MEGRRTLDLTSSRQAITALTIRLETSGSGRRQSSTCIVVSVAVAGQMACQINSVPRISLPFKTPIACPAERFTRQSQ